MGAAVALSVFVMIAWSVIGFGVAGSLRGAKSETVGLSTILIAPGGALLAALAALVAGLPAYGERWWLRWILLPVGFLVLGGVTFGLLAR
jgi:hypothetical protein